MLQRRNGLIQRYSINITEQQTGIVSTIQTTNQSIVIRERHPFYRYGYIVTAVTVGPGPYSVASVIHMPEAGKGAGTLFNCYCGHIIIEVCMICKNIDPQMLIITILELATALLI